MPKPTKNHHLKLDHNTWLFRKQIPEDCRQIFNGRREYLVSTGCKEAEVLDAQGVRDIELALIDKKIRNFRKGLVSSLPEVEKLTLKAKQKYEQIQDQLKIYDADPAKKREAEFLYDYEDVGNELEEELSDKLITPSGKAAIRDHAVESNIGLGEALDDLYPHIGEAIKTQVNLATGKALDVELEAYLNLRPIKRNALTYQREQRQKIETFCKSFPLIIDVNVNSVKRWIRSKEEEDLASSSIRKYLSVMKNYWEHLKEKDHVSLEVVNPFKDIRLKTYKKHRREIFTLDDARKLVEQPTKQSIKYPYLTYFIKLGLLTGCRVKELCEMKIEDVKIVDNVKVIDLTEDMTKAGTAGARKIPVSKRMEPVIDWVMLDAKKHKRPHFFKGKRNRDGVRNHHMSKRFSFHKQELGFESNVKVAHSFRHSANMILTKQIHNVPQEHREALLGWTTNGNGSMSNTAYGHMDESYPLAERKIDMEKIAHEYWFIPE